MSPDSAFWGPFATKLAAIKVCLEALDYGTRPWEYLPVWLGCGRPP